MNLRLLTILGLSTLLTACGGESNDDSNDLNEDDTDSIEVPTPSTEASVNPNAIGLSGNESDDLSLIHGMGFSKRLSQIPFVNIEKYVEQVKKLSKDEANVPSQQDADMALKALSQITNGFKDISPEQNENIHKNVAAFFYQETAKYEGFEGINIEKFCEGVKAGSEGKFPSQELIELYSSKTKPYEEKRMQEQAQKAWEAKKKQFAIDRAAGQKAAPDQYAFLDKKAKEAGIKKTSTGLLYEVIKEGEGEKPKSWSTVTAHYAGTTIDGKEFDSSFKRGKPLDFSLQQVIAGWTEGLQLMSPGAKYKFYIPQELGYGARGAGANIPPFATLIFEVELISFK